MCYEDVVRKHYADESVRTKDSPQSTMRDQYVRQQEVAAITKALKTIARGKKKGVLCVLEIGCGNGYLLSQLMPLFPKVKFSAIEYSPELLAISKARKLVGADIHRGDCRELQYPDRSFDVVIGERVIINLLDSADQKRALSEIARVLFPGGYYLMVEGFVEPHQILNQAREELGLNPVPPPFHNLYFSESILIDMGRLGLREHSVGIPSNFLSTHYFIARVLHESIRQPNSKIHNTHFVDFFDRALPNNIGNYGAIKFYSFRKQGRPR